MWNAIQYVGTPLALIAFIAAAIAAVLRVRIRQRLTHLNTLPDNQRAEYLTHIAETYSIKDDNLTREQKFQLMSKVLDDRATRFRTIARTSVTLAIIVSIVVVAIVLTKTDGSDPIVPAPGPDPDADVEVFSRHRIVDLSNWQHVSEDKANEKLSPGVFKDVLKLRKLRPSVTSLTLRHASSGKPTPEFLSSTHHIAVRETTEQPQGTMANLRIFDISADISGEPVGEWFECVIDATYWNAFNSPTQAWTAMPIVHPTQQASIEVVFPLGKIPRTWERREGSRDNKESELVTDPNLEVIDGGRKLRWRVDAPRLNWVYRVVWDW